MQLDDRLGEGWYSRSAAVLNSRVVSKTVSQVMHGRMAWCVHGGSISLFHWGSFLFFFLNKNWLQKKKGIDSLAGVGESLSSLWRCRGMMDL